MIDEEDKLDEMDIAEYEEQENLALADCVCGAYHWSQKQQRFVQVADCVCGRT